MPSTVALFGWFVLLVALLCFDPAKDSGVSAALWVPVTWIFIVGSRLPSQWLGGQVGQVTEAIEEGNPLDRTIYLGLTVLAVGILLSRSFKWGPFCARNLALTASLVFALLSVLWSDFAFIAFKRWIRDLGTYMVILVALSDPRPLEAFRTLLRRVCYLLIPLSVVLIKYFPAMTRQYDPWSGLASYSGATTSKNMLGVLCLISGLFFFWDTVTRWPDRKKRRIKRIILLNFLFLAMTLWLLKISDSATSRVCLALGCLVIAAAHSKTFQRRPALLKVMIPAGICLYLTLTFGFGFDINAELAKSVGRNPNLTGRTVIWSAVLSTHTNPLLGTGYESFWLGPLLNEVWRKTGPGINEAHNGYLEVYLNLGLIGLILLGGFLIGSYRTICKTLTSAPGLGSLTLALWTVLLFYNVTESAFRGALIWVIFLLGAIVVPAQAVRGTLRVREASFDKSKSKIGEPASV
jgi:exopolysaccharide production protein ExoQ